MNLRELQNFFFKELTDSEKTPLRKRVKTTPAFNLEARLAVYSDAYEIRLINSLRDDFPRVLKAVGKKDFTSLARSYVRTFPSRSPDLANLGADFSRFLAQSSVGKNFLADLAALDWALFCVNCQLSEPAVAKDKIRLLSTHEPNRLCLKLHPLLQELKSEHHFYLIYSADGEAVYRDLDNVEEKIFTALKKQSRLDRFFEALTEIPELQNDSVFLQNTLQSFMACGIIHDIQIL